MASTWPVSVALITGWIGILLGKRVKARRGIEIEKNPLREIEERWDRDFQDG